MTLKPKALFIVDKYCNADQCNGLAEWENNLSLSLDELGICNVKSFHPDFEFLRFGDNSSQNLWLTLQNFNPDVIFFVVYNLTDVSPNRISALDIQRIKALNKSKMVAIFGDLNFTSQRKIADKIGHLFDLNVFTANSSVHKQLKYAKKFNYLWVPKSQKFQRGSEFQDIDISFLGSQTTARKPYLKVIQKQAWNSYIGGGERFKHLTTEEYIAVHQNSKISLSFSRAGGFVPVINARAFEVISMGSLLMEEAGPETAKLFNPYKDYIPFFSKQDMIKKINYYLKNDEERQQIIDNAYLKYEKFYSSQRFWDLIFLKLDDKSDNHLNTKKLANFDYTNCSIINIANNWGNIQLNLKKDHLKRLTFFQKIKMYLLNHLPKNKIGIKLLEILYKMKYPTEIYHDIVRLINRIEKKYTYNGNNLLIINNLRKILKK